MSTFRATVEWADAVRHLSRILSLHLHTLSTSTSSAGQWGHITLLRPGQDRGPRISERGAVLRSPRRRRRLIAARAGAVTGTTFASTRSHPASDADERKKPPLRNRLRGWQLTGLTCWWRGAGVCRSTHYSSYLISKTAIETKLAWCAVISEYQVPQALSLLGSLNRRVALAWAVPCRETINAKIRQVTVVK